MPEMPRQFKDCCSELCSLGYPLWLRGTWLIFMTVSAWFCSVQFSSRWYICGWESSYVLHPFSQKFPQHCHWNSLNISMTSQTFFAVRVKWQFITLNACTATRQCEQMLCHTCGRKDVCSSQMSVNFAFISTRVCFRGWQLLKLQWLWQSHVIGRCQPV